MADIQLYFEDNRGHLMLLEGDFIVELSQNNLYDRWDPSYGGFSPMQLTSAATTVKLTHRFDSYTLMDLGPKEDYEYGMV